MSKRLAFLIAIVVASAVGYLAIRGLRTRHAPSVSSPVAERPADSAQGAPQTSLPGSAPSPAAASEPVAIPADAVNLAAPEIGGHIESVTSEEDREDRAAIHLIDRARPEDSSWRATAAAPQDIVIGFFEQQAALITAIVINPNTRTSVRWPKDVEVWTSMESPTTGFVKAASLTLVHEDVEQTMTFAPVEARFVQIRVVSQYQTDSVVGMGKIKVIEARRAGYTPLLDRNPKLARLLAGVASDSFCGARSRASESAGVHRRWPCVRQRVQCGSTHRPTAGPRKQLQGSRPCALERDVPASLVLSEWLRRESGHVGPRPDRVHAGPSGGRESHAPGICRGIRHRGARHRSATSRPASRTASNAHWSTGSDRVTS